MPKVLYFWHGFTQMGTTFKYNTFNIVAPLIYYILPNVWKASYTITISIFVMFRSDLPLARISSSLVLYRSSAVVLSVWRRDRNRMDSYRVSTVDVSESPIANGARGTWQQQRCDSLHCHEEWWCSLSPRVVVFCIDKFISCVLPGPRSGFFTLAKRS